MFEILSLLTRKNLSDQYNTYIGYVNYIMMNKGIVFKTSPNGKLKPRMDC